VGARLEAHVFQAPEVKGAFLELGDTATGLADKVVVVDLGQLIARAVTEIEAPNQPEPREEIEGPIDGHKPYLTAAPTNLFKALVPIRSERLEDRNPLRRRLVAQPP
jgi:hypothetical protein